MRLKKWSEAERFHRAALEAEPTHVGAHISFGTMLARNVSVVSWCRVWWVDANFTFSFRFCNIQSSRSSEAEQYFKRAIRLAPLDSSVHHHYGNFSSPSTALKHLHIMEKKSEFLIWWIINFPFPHHPHNSWVPHINLETRRSLREPGAGGRVVAKRLPISHRRCDVAPDARPEARVGEVVSSGEHATHASAITTTEHKFPICRRWIYDRTMPARTPISARFSICSVGHNRRRWAIKPHLISSPAIRRPSAIWRNWEPPRTHESDTTRHNTSWRIYDYGVIIIHHLIFFYIICRFQTHHRRRRNTSRSSQTGSFVNIWCNVIWCLRSEAVVLFFISLRFLRVIM